MRPAMRLSALMGLRVIYVLTHDSIGVGEDGPTHQPIEHLASYRAMPNIYTFRPCDVVETAEAWEIALSSEHTPSLLALSRQNLPTLRHTSSSNLSRKGAYVIAGDDKSRQATILATGSEVSIAVEAMTKLAAEGIKTAVVSMPCWELFDQQSEDYKISVLGTAPRVAIEAGSSFGWAKYTGDQGRIIALDDFGASGPATDLYRHFGLTADNLVSTIKTLIKG